VPLPRRRNAQSNQLFHNCRRVEVICECLYHQSRLSAEKGNAVVALMLAGAGLESPHLPSVSLRQCHGLNMEVLSPRTTAFPANAAIHEFFDCEALHPYSFFFLFNSVMASLEQGQHSRVPIAESTPKAHRSHGHEPESSAVMHFHRTCKAFAERCGSALSVFSQASGRRMLRFLSRRTLTATVTPALSWPSPGNDHGGIGRTHPSRELRP